MVRSHHRRRGSAAILTCSPSASDSSPPQPVLRRGALGAIQTGNDTMGSGMRGAARCSSRHGAGASQHLGAHRKRGRRVHQGAGRRRGGHRHRAVSAGRAGGGDRRHRSLPRPAAATRDVHPAIREGVVPSIRPRRDRRRGGPDAAPQRRAASRDRRQRDGDRHRDSADHRHRLECHRHQHQPGLRPEPGRVTTRRSRRSEPVLRLAWPSWHRRPTRTSTAWGSTGRPRPRTCTSSTASR